MKIRFQGEDWGWLHEHSLKGASTPQLARRESRKNPELPKRQETIVLWCARRGDSEHHLNELQRWVQAAAISADHRDKHEMLRRLLQSPRSLCASTGHYTHAPPPHPWSLCSLPLPGSHEPGRTSPGEHTAHLRVLHHQAGLCTRRFAPHSVPLPPPGLSEAEPLNQLLIELRPV